MGISIRAGYRDDQRDWTYSYGTFALLRDALSAELGFPDRKERYEPMMTDHRLLGYWVHPTEEHHIGDTVDEPEDDIDFLMLHQDCEGILPYWAALRAGDRLREIAEGMEEPRLFGFNARGLAFELAGLLEWAGENGYMVHFS
ncbi:hypothetical protein SEA_ZOOMAN_264 [Microbacterium phage Zooman]|nr:hypothetical protein SEA_ZOOMAN_264 [Microbacterium phage Zooman]